MVVSACVLLLVLSVKPVFWVWLPVVLLVWHQVVGLVRLRLRCLHPGVWLGRLVWLGAGVRLWGLVAGVWVRLWGLVAGAWFITWKWVCIAWLIGLWVLVACGWLLCVACDCISGRCLWLTVVNCKWLKRGETSWCRVNTGCSVNGSWSWRHFSIVERMLNGRYMSRVVDPCFARGTQPRATFKIVHFHVLMSSA